MFHFAHHDIIQPVPQRVQPTAMIGENMGIIARDKVLLPKYWSLSQLEMNRLHGVPRKLRRRTREGERSCVCEAADVI